MTNSDEIDYKTIYRNMFSLRQYNLGHREVFNFALEEVIKHRYKKIIDISSGRGLFLKCLKQLDFEIDLTSTDLEKFHNLDVKFISLNLADPSDRNKITEQYEFLSCLDVLEHLEESSIDEILQFFKRIAKNLCFAIANHSDNYIGIELHLIIKEKRWWDEIIGKYFEIDSSIDNGNLYYYVLRRRA